MVSRRSWRQIARKMLQHLPPQALQVEMGVNLGSRNTFMPQQGLNHAQVGPSLKQVSGKGVAERMRTDGFSDAGRAGQFLDNVKHHDGG